MSNGTSSAWKRMGRRALVPLALALTVGCARHQVTAPAAAAGPTTSEASTGTAMRPAATPARGEGNIVKAAATGEHTAGARNVSPPSAFRPVAELRDVHFDFDKSDLRHEDQATLEADASVLKTHPTWQALIEGHTDERGTDQYNLALGDRRAKAALNYLVAQGVAASRLAVISYGEERPLCTESAESCWSRNRRAHFLVKPE